MRIRTHIALLQSAAILGAIGLAAVVGILLVRIEVTAQDATRAGLFHERMSHMLDEARQYEQSIATLTDRTAPTALAVARPSLDRWYMQLTRLRGDEAFTHSAQLEAAVAALSQLIRANLPAQPPDLADLHRLAGGFRQQMRELEQSTSLAQLDAVSEAERQRRLAMVVIAVCCIVYLATVEHSRHWSMRRLVRPVEELANAALLTMRGEKDPARKLTQCTTAELNDLTRMLRTWVQTLKQKVAERTVELEQQKAQLEHEVAVRRQAEDQLRHAAFHDRLTGLCNRELLLDRLERCLLRARRHEDYHFAVLFLDIDRFKEVNDSLGHTAGDQLLVAISNRLEDCLRTTDTVARFEGNTVARIGGDEFVVLLDGISGPEDANAVAERMQEALHEPFLLRGQEVFTTASIGIATSGLDYDSPDNLLRDADAAMYHAKAGGKARHEVFNQHMHDEAMARLQLGNDLRHAIDNDEFRVYYQPIVELRTGRIRGFEALVRWQHPDRGLVSPIHFIDHTEETGLIVTLGRQILRKACQQLREWSEQFPGHGLTMSVNVSRRQIVDPDIVHDVREVLAATGIDPATLKLEITESIIMADPGATARVLNDLRGLGVQIHMDDFGTGYSSLSCLHRFPIDVVKIDREFMSTMGGNRDYAGVVHTVVVLAHKLNMLVTVEGVESEEQLSQLRVLEADYAQGYHIARPLPADEAEKLIAADQRWLCAAVA